MFSLARALRRPSWIRKSATRRFGGLSEAGCKLCSPVRRRNTLEGACGTVSTRAMEARDIEAILAIQSASPEIAQWTARDYSRVAAGEMPGWLTEEKNQVTGFLVARRIASDLEILNFAVTP